MKNRVKLSVVLFLVIAIITGAPFALTSLYVRAKLLTANRGMLLESVHWLFNDYRFVTHQFDSLQTMLNIAAGDLETFQTDPTFERKAALRDVVEVCPSVNTLTLADPRGELVNMASRNKILPSERRDHFLKIDFEAARKARTIFIGPFYLSKTRDEVNLPICFPIRKQGDLIGFLAAEFNLQPMADLLRSYAFRYNGRAYLLDAGGRVIVQSSKESSSRADFGADPLFREYTRDLSKTNASDRSDEYFDVDRPSGKLRMLKPVADYPFVLLAERPAGFPNTPSNAAFYQSMASGYVFTLLGGMILSWILAGMIVKRG